jgi:hypothetical protein
MERYQILSSAPVGVGDTQSSHPEYPRIHGSFNDQDEAAVFAKVLRSTYNSWQLTVTVVVFDTTTQKIVQK